MGVIYFLGQAVVSVVLSLVASKIDRYLQSRKIRKRALHSSVGRSFSTVEKGSRPSLLFYTMRRV